MTFNIIVSQEKRIIMQEDFFSEKYTNWLNNLFKNSTTRDIYNDKNDIKKITLMFDYIKEYLYSNFAPIDIKESYMPYLNAVNLTYDIKYNDMYLEISVMPSASIYRKIIYIKTKWYND